MKPTTCTGPEQRSAVAGAARRLRVALAEDDESQRQALQSALELDGFEVLAFEDGFELFDYFDAPGRARVWPDAIVTDVKMPGRSGLDALERARARGVSTLAFVITGAADRGVRARTAQLGNAFVFEKPIDLERLSQAIWQLLHVQLE